MNPLKTQGMCKFWNDKTLFSLGHFYIIREKKRGPLGLINAVGRAIEGKGGFFIEGNH